MLKHKLCLVIAILSFSQAYNAALVRSTDVDLVPDNQLITSFDHSASFDVRPYDGSFGNISAVKDGDSVIATASGGCGAIQGCGANFLASASLNYRIFLELTNEQAFFEAFSDSFGRLTVGVNYFLSTVGVSSTNPTTSGEVQGPQFRPTDSRLNAKISVKGNHSSQFNARESSVGNLSGEFVSRSGVLEAIVNPFAEQMYIDVTLEAFIRGGFRGTKNSTQSVSYQAIADPYISLPEEYVDFLKVTNTVFSREGTSSAFGSQPTTVSEPSSILIFFSSILVFAGFRLSQLKKRNYA